MPLHECPGPDRKKPIVPEELQCPACGAEIEMWTNEAQTTCPSCSKVITRDELDAGK
jgi:predicted RNA-binding Zn-ribbon protein involved in translation (DUF1610 family)